MATGIDRDLEIGMPSGAPDLSHILGVDEGLEPTREAIAGLWVPELVQVIDRKIVLASGAYTVEDVVSESTSAPLAKPWVFKDCAKIAGGGGRIIDAMILAETTNIASWFSLFLHNDVPTCNLFDAAANTAFILPDSDISQAQIDFPACSDIGTGMSSTTSTPSTVGGLPKTFVCKHDSRDLWGVLAIKNALDLADLTRLTIKLWIEQT